MGENIKKNWKTTVVGIALLVGAVATAVVALLDGDPSTSLDIGSIIAALSGVGLLAAKDGDK